MRSFIRLSVVVLLAYTSWSATLRLSVVEDHSGNAVVGAELKLAKKGFSELVANTESDGDGHFDAVELEDAEYNLSVSKQNYIETSLRLAAKSLQGPLELRLVRLGTVSGRLTDPNGAPLANIFVLALGGPRPLEATTNASGEYRIHGLIPGEYTVAAAYGQPTIAVGTTGNLPRLGAAGAGAVFYPEKVKVISGESFSNIDFSLTTSSLFKLSGVVLAPNMPAGRYWIALAPVDHPEIAISVATVADDGSFHIEGARPGSYNIFASGLAEGRGRFGAVLNEHPLFAREHVEVTTQDLNDVQLKVTPGLSLPVRVRGGDGCSPKAKVTATVLEDWAAELTRSSQAAHDGSAVLTPLAPAKYRVTAVSEDCYQSAETVVDLSAGNATGVEVSLLRGASLRIHVQPPMPVILLGDSKTRTELPGGNGKLEFSGLPPGHYRLRGLAASNHQLVEVDIRAGEVRNMEWDLRKPEEK